MRHTIVFFFVFAAMLTGTAPARERGGSVRPQDPLTTDDPNLYLFVDDHWVAESHGVVRIRNQPQVRPEPILWPDDPKTQQDCAWGNVIRELDGRFRLWYCTMAMGPDGKGGHGMARAGVWGRGDDFSFHPRSEADRPEIEHMLGKYAESTDGIHWVKPKLGLIEFKGNRSNNIVLNGAGAARQTGGYVTNFDGLTVLRDDAEPDPNKRYKMVAHWESVHCYDNHPISGSLGRSAEKMKKYLAARGKRITYSPDGLHWNQPLERIRVGPGDRFLVVRDHRHGRWRAYTRDYGYDAAGLATSEDLVHWSRATKHLPRAGIENHPTIESLVPFNYGNQDLGFLITQVKTQNMLGLFAFLVSHHDGEPWKRIAKVPAEPFIPPAEGTYYVSGSVPLHNEPFIVGDRMFIYFNAFSARPHPPHPKFGRRCIGVATLRRDGFVGLTAGKPAAGADAVGASLVTKPIPVTGRNLYVNVEPRGEGGRVEVALLDADRNGIPGFTFKEAVPIGRDAVRHPVTWKNRRDVSVLRGKQIMVHVRLTGEAVLYALKIGS